MSSWVFEPQVVSGNEILNRNEQVYFIPPAGKNPSSIENSLGRGGNTLYVSLYLMYFLTKMNRQHNTPRVTAMFSSLVLICY